MSTYLRNFFSLEPSILSPLALLHGLRYILTYFKNRFKLRKPGFLNFIGNQVVVVLILLRHSLGPASMTSQKPRAMTARTARASANL